MYKNPHEAVERLPEFQKNFSRERWLIELNKSLIGLPLPEDFKECSADFPLIYIVGLPRSGTTLISQICSYSLDLGYISNLIAKFWERPSVGIRLSQSVYGDDPGKRITFESRYGETDGGVGPHEFGYFWRKWLQLDAFPTHHIADKDLDRLDSKGLRDTLVNEILLPFAKPVVLKSVLAGLHANYLTQLYPKTLFVHISRDMYTVGCSILKARMVRHGAYDAWWSLKPSTWPFSTSDPGEEVGRQIIEAHREMQIELQRPGVQCLQISYEDVCSDPQQILFRIQEALVKMGTTVNQLRRVEQLFVPSPPPPLPASIDFSLQKTLAAGGYL